MEGNLALESGILAILLVLVRIFFLVHKVTTGHTKVWHKKRVNAAKTLVCIGSGGHTTEMLCLMASLDFLKYSPRHYVMARTDETSYLKVVAFENEKTKDAKDYFIRTIPRSRAVNQSYFSSIFTTIYSILYCIPMMLRLRPDLILCNGPGTCIPICFIAFLLKAAFICDTKIVFVESFCRTQTFSLSGNILIYIADNILVQWPPLKRKLKRADYIGQLL
ncbi:PREDICTED: UDP-N-acetylglucosamine transferase subunit ALG14 homolog [Nicrophorus vespilloides]|uniref:UDP-N-acetylglucosamine transferase subunit ALG14 n=1 Tax=Nicrophorus vespilloides TaxID=110193 RepID=A0ABM1N332_NICVS|nr:PREDICTED: UDP-N-acetylglucosamine transferase subunit ALG14 homolog [Nicrophorus vespilloides]